MIDNPHPKWYYLPYTWQVITNEELHLRLGVWYSVSDRHAHTYNCMIHLGEKKWLHQIYLRLRVA